jgi:hypothetical protein
MYNKKGVEKEKEKMEGKVNKKRRRRSFSLVIVTGVVMAWIVMTCIIMAAVICIVVVIQSGNVMSILSGFGNLHCKGNSKKSIS